MAEKLTPSPQEMAEQAMLIDVTYEFCHIPPRDDGAIVAFKERTKHTLVLVYDGPERENLILEGIVEEPHSLSLARRALQKALEQREV